MEGFRRVLGHDQMWTLNVTGNMGALLNAMGRYDEAADVLQPEESRARRVFVGGNRRYLGIYLSRLGETLTGKGAFSAARKLLLEAHELVAEGFVYDHDNTTNTVNRLISLYDAWHTTEPGKGYDAKAAEWRAKLPKEEPKEVE